MAKLMPARKPVPFSTINGFGRYIVTGSLPIAILIGAIRINHTQVFYVKLLVVWRENRASE
jgi:hypothetical protein